MPKPKPPKDALQYEEAVNQTARSYCPDIYPCCKCQWPVVRGYCCNYCGDSAPYEK